MSRLTVVDVRPVEPKHRFECIMAAYESLSIGETLQLTVDHDPKCMYYTLKATRGDNAFSFDYLEDGPVTWRVHVRKNVS
jgi:regulator of cell morphogenesis and NO signaling